MMGKEGEPQPALFHYGVNLDQRVRRDHPLRQVVAVIDFDFAYGEVEQLYGAVGHESVPPPVILKLLFLLHYYNVRSERELFETLAERLDWLWFLGWELDATIPNHSVLSKARRRWGAMVFRELFARVVSQCREAGLIGGRKVHCDASLVDANASDEAIEDAICIEIAEQIEERLDEREPEQPTEGVSRVRRYSTTDPDAAVVGRRGRDRARPRYKTHRAVDDLQGVITATVITPGDVNEGRLLGRLIDEHQAASSTTVETVVADSTYGTNENLLACHDRGIAPHVPPLREKNNAKAQRERGLFTRENFRYDAERDEYHCPAGQVLRRSEKKPDRLGLVRYGGKRSVCGRCPIKEQCTRGQRRILTRHVRQAELEQIEQRVRSVRRRDLIRRKTLMEGSFACAVRYGYKRARCRGLERVTIQDLLIATVQNVLLLCRNLRRRPAAAQAIRAADLLALANASPVRPKLQQIRNAVSDWFEHTAVVLAPLPI